jgi:Lipocalin-like domain
MFDITGAWHLTGVYAIVQGTGERIEPLGGRPVGCVIFDPSGYMIGIMASASREPAVSDADIQKLFRTLIAYSGRWSIDEGEYIITVDIAWDPNWVGTKQVRYYSFDGRTLSLHTPLIEHPSFPGQKVIGYADWQREPLT